MIEVDGQPSHLSEYLNEAYVSRELVELIYEKALEIGTTQHSGTYYLVKLSPASRL